MRSYTSLTNSYLLKHKFRTFLTICGIIVSIAMFTVIWSVYFSGIENELQTVKNSYGDYEVQFKKLNSEKLNILLNNAEIKNGGVIRDEGVFIIEGNRLTPSLSKIKIRACDNATFSDILSIKLTYGRLPKAQGEIIVDKRFYAVLMNKGMNEELTGLLNNAKIQYKIVGAYENPDITNSALTYLDLKSSIPDKTAQYSYYANIKAENGKVAIMKKIASANSISYEANSTLLYLIGEGPDAHKNNMTTILFFVAALLVAVCTIAVIYNSFNISVMERVKHFGILRSIGATRAQIRVLVLKEAAILCAISIPIGLLIGFGATYITFNYLMNGFLDTFKINFHWTGIAITIILGMLTVFISAYFPARTAAKVSPVEAIRGGAVLKGDKIKNRKGILAKLLLRFEGQVAYKNIKRSRKRFYATLTSLMLSLVMYVFFTNFMDVVMASNSAVGQNIKVDAVFDKIKNSRVYMDDAFADKLENTSGISMVYRISLSKVSMNIEKNKINKAFEETLKVPEYKGQYITPNVQLVGYDRNAFELLNHEAKLNVSYDDFKNNDKAVIADLSAGTNSKGFSFYDRFTSYKNGDKFSIPRVDANYIENPSQKSLMTFMDKDNNVQLEVGALTDMEIISGTPSGMGYAIIVTNETFNKITGLSKYNSVCLNYSTSGDRENLYETLNAFADEYSVKFVDIYVQKNALNKLIHQIEILVYGFIGLIVLIAAVNIINAVTINLLVKKKEYAIFKAIGMTKRQFKKLIVLEGGLYGIIACLLGLPIGYVLSVFGVMFINPVGLYGYNMKVWPYITGSVGIIVITIMATLIPLRKLNEMNIVDTLKIEE